VKLQQRSSGSWRTLAQMPLDSHSSAIFTKKLGTSTIRIAISVNQAGPGFLGSTSGVLGYQAT
jgi:hypothetical protein